MKAKIYKQAEGGLYKATEVYNKARYSEFRPKEEGLKELECYFINTIKGI